MIRGINWFKRLSTIYGHVPGLQGERGGGGVGEERRRQVGGVEGRRGGGEVLISAGRFFLRNKR